MSIEYNRMQHDFGIVDPTSSTNVVGLVCARDPKTGEILYKEYDDEYLAQQFFTGGASYVNTPPQRRLPIPLSDFRSGFGLDIYDSNDPKRYFSSYGADLRFKDRATLSYDAKSATMPGIVTLSITNADMELNSNWAIESGGNSAQSAVQNHTPGGTYSWELNNTTVTYQDVLTAGGTWNNSYRGCYVSFTCWVWSNIAAKGRIQIDDGVTTSYSSTHSGSSTWEQLTVVAYLGATATRLRIEMADLNHVVYFDDYAVAIEPTFGTTGIGIDYNSEHYVAKGNILLKLNAGGTGFDTVKSFPTTITDLKVFGVSGTDYLFIALGLSTPYQYMVAAETFTVSNAAVTNFQYFQPVSTTALTFYGNDTNSTIRSTTNPLNGGVAWSDVTQVDSDLYDITGLKSLSGALYIAKEDKPYYLSSAGAVQKDLAPECESAYATTSGANSDIWLGNWYYPYGAQYLLEIGSTNTRRNPSEFCTNQSDFTGRVAAVTHDGDQWLIVCLNNTTKVEVMTGREETVDGTTDWVWHPYKELTMGNCSAAWTSTIVQKRIWIASATSGEALQYIPLPTGYGNLTADTNKLYNVSATANYFETPFLHGNFKADQKGWIKVVATLGHAYDADIYWTIQYKKLEDSSYTNIGNLVGTATNRTHTLYLPVDGSSYKPTSTMMRFKVIGVTDDTAKTPILNSLVIEAVLYPPDGSGNVIACTVKDIKTMITGKGGEGEKGSQTLIKNVIDAALAATYPVTIYDIEGTTRTVKFMPLPTGTPRRFPVRKSGQEIDWNYNLIMSEVTTS